jgi:hypothetical protein
MQFTHHLLRGANKRRHGVNSSHSAHPLAAGLFALAPTMLIMGLACFSGLACRLAQVGFAHRDAFAIGCQDQDRAGVWCLSLTDFALGVERVEVLGGVRGDLFGLPFGRASILVDLGDDFVERILGRLPSRSLRRRAR